MLDTELSSKLVALKSKKRAWTPIEPKHTAIPQGVEETLMRALSLRILEIPVGEFITAATKRDLPISQEALSLLHSNIEDELRHDLALNNVVNSLPFEVPEYKEPQQFKERAIDLANSKDHPIQVARTLEVGVFFVLLPIFRFLGNVGMKTVSADITFDERVHVATNTMLSQALNLECSRELNQLRREAVAWMVETLKPQNVPLTYRQFADPQFWLRQSDNLFYTGKAPELADTKKTNVIAFFEVDRRNQPKYASVS